MTYWKTKKILIKMTRSERASANIFEHWPLTKSPIVLLEEEKAIVGINANGNCRDIKQFSRSFILRKRRKYLTKLPPSYRVKDKEPYPDRSSISS